MLHYRCVYRDEYPGDNQHPKGLAVAEARILPALDGWLSELFDRDHLDETVEAILSADRGSTDEPMELRRARMKLVDADAKLDQYLKALDQGVDAALLAPRIRAAQAEQAAARAVLQQATQPIRPLSEEEIRTILADLGNLPSLLAHAEPAMKRQLYAGAGVALRYERRPEGELVTAALRVEFLRVGGVSCPPATRETTFLAS